MRVAAFILTAILAVATITIGSPTTTYASPDGKIDASTVPYGRFVHITVTGLTPNSPLSVSYSTGLTDPWHVVENGLVSTNASGAGAVSFTPVVVRDINRNYTGPVYVQVCDGAGVCIIFTITVGGSLPAPLPVAHNNTDRAFCELFNMMLHNGYVGPAPLEVLFFMGPNAVFQLGVRCGLSNAQIDDIFDIIFGD